MKMISLQSIGNPMFYVDDFIKTGQPEEYPYSHMFAYLVVTIGNEFKNECETLSGAPLDSSQLLGLFSLAEKIIMYPYKTEFNQFMKSFLFGLETQLIDDIPVIFKYVECDYDRLLILMEQLTCDYIYSSSDEVITEISSFMESIKVSNS